MPELKNSERKVLGLGGRKDPQSRSTLLLSAKTVWKLYFQKVKQKNLGWRSAQLVQLYNIKEDPTESNEVSDEYPEIVDKLLIRLADYYVSVFASTNYSSNNRGYL